MNLHSWDKSHSVIMCYYFHTSLKMVCLYFAKEFCVCAHEGSSSGFGVRVTGLIMWVREHSLSLSLYFLNEFVWFWCYFFPWISSRLQWWLHEDLWIQLECNCFTCFQWFFFLIAFYSVFLILITIIVMSEYPWTIYLTSIFSCKLKYKYWKINLMWKNQNQLTE